MGASSLWALAMIWGRVLLPAHLRRALTATISKVNLVDMSLSNQNVKQTNFFYEEKRKERLRYIIITLKVKSKFYFFIKIIY